MKRMQAALLAATVIATFASGASAQSDTGAVPIVQKVSVKGVARFDFDKAVVNADDGLKLMSEVRSMKNVTWQTISVVGHTDAIGPEDYNQRLAERRAAAVQTFLIDKGVKPERIRTSGKGKLQPVATNATARGRALNRRTEIEFQGLQAVAQ